MASYVSLILKWNAKINLIGPATETDIWSRHIEDSLQLVPLIPDTATTLVDLGSGAGLPGMVIAITRPDLLVTLVERDQRKAAFLSEAKALLQLPNVIVQAVDISTIRDTYDVVTARALSSLTNLLAMAEPLMNEGSIALFPKGAAHRAEMDEASDQWRFIHTLNPSATHPEASIITISELSRKTLTK